MPPRKKIKKANAGEAAVGSSSGSSAEVAQPASGTIARRNVRGRRGGLKDMPNMPLDVLFEIFTIMHPRDLLNLARTSKPFRAFLLARSAQPLWKTAIERVPGLPKCPSYMTEPAFINLLFFPHCHNCLKSNVQTVIFEFSARYCPSCRKEMTVGRSDIWELQKDILSVTDTFCFPVIYDSFRINTARYHKPDVFNFLSLWEGLSDTGAKKELVTTQVEKLRLINEASEQYLLWKGDQKVKRAEELDRMRADRFASILDRLRREGWSEELDLLNNYQRSSLRRQKFATKPEHLTERGWQKIRADVVFCMENIKAARLKEERRQQLGERFVLFEKAFKTYRPGNRTAESDLDPRVIDLAMMPEFRTMLEPPDADMELLEDKDAMSQKFDAAIIKWRQDRKNELSTMIRQSHDVPEGVDPLSLATAYFACELCDRQDLRYPAVVAHLCTGRATSGDLYESTLAQFRNKTWLPQGRTTPWSTKYLSATTAVSRLRTVLETCGLDPKVATYEEVKQCTSRLHCGSRPGSEVYRDGCFQESKTFEVEVYTCERALKYSLRKSGGWSYVHIRWECVSAEEATVVKKFEDEHSNVVDWDQHVHGCNYCDYTGRRRILPTHLRGVHDINTTSDTVGEHCYLHLDANVKSPEIHLTRHEDGRIKAGFSPSSHLGMLSLDWDFPLALDWDSDLDWGFDLGFDGMWDSDSDEFGF